MTVPRKALEVGACKDLEGHIFTIGSANKGKDGDMLRTSVEKMATYIGTKYGSEAAQEWTSGKKITLSEPYMETETCFRFLMATETCFRETCFRFHFND